MHFSLVSICTSGPSCLSKLGEFAKHAQTPTLLILDIPKLGPEDDITKAEGRHDSGIAACPDPMYGISLLRFICLERERGRISDLVIPIALVSSNREVLPGVLPSAFKELNDISWFKEDDESSLSARCVDCGAVDVLIGRVSQERVKGLSIHCYRAAKKHTQQVVRARKLSWVGAPEIQKSKDSDYVYLREKM